jgi:VIT1/CCC1 family predicted Fe2+/Mn2+ transporter
MPHSRSRHPERHVAERMSWLRAGVLGANDGIVSTASLLVGVAAAGSDHDGVLVAGLAGLVAGAMSMAAGEYVSVSSQADAEDADLARERRELDEEPEAELKELTRIYEQRGLEAGLAREVAEQLTAHDALGAHARDELGHSDVHAARPIQAAAVSAVSFAVGAGLPLGLAYVASPAHLPLMVASGSLGFLAALGVLSARVGALRVTLWGSLAMAATFGVGRLFDVTVG